MAFLHRLLGRHLPYPIVNWLYGLYVTVRLHECLDGSLPQDIAQSYVHWNCTLKSKTDVTEAIRHLRRLRAFLHHDKPKNWDLARSLAFILTHGNSESPVLEMGCGHWGGMLLRSLALYGYRRLYGCDVLLKKDFRRGPITYLRRNLLTTGFPDCSFRFVAALSVIEHGVPVDQYLREAYRLLVPGGYLLTSTDYWHEPISTVESVYARTQSTHGRVFDIDSLAEVLRMAKSTGFHLYDPMDFRTLEKVVHWAGRSYTFAYFVCRKP